MPADKKAQRHDVAGSVLAKTSAEYAAIGYPVQLWTRSVLAGGRAFFKEILELHK